MHSPWLLLLLTCILVAPAVSVGPGSSAEENLAYLGLCAPGCFNKTVGDEECNPMCMTALCHFDLADCNHEGGSWNLDNVSLPLATGASFLKLGQDPTLEIDMQLFPMRVRKLWPSQLELYKAAAFLVKRADADDDHSLTLAELAAGYPSLADPLNPAGPLLIALSKDIGEDMLSSRITVGGIQRFLLGAGVNARGILPTPLMMGGSYKSYMPQAGNPGFDDMPFPELDVTQDTIIKTLFAFHDIDSSGMISSHELFHHPLPMIGGLSSILTVNASSILCDTPGTLLCGEGGPISMEQFEAMMNLLYSVWPMTSQDGTTFEVYKNLPRGIDGFDFWMPLPMTGEHPVTFGWLVVPEHFYFSNNNSYGLPPGGGGPPGPPSGHGDYALLAKHKNSQSPNPGSRKLLDVHDQLSNVSGLVKFTASLKNSSLEDATYCGGVLVRPNLVLTAARCLLMGGLTPDNAAGLGHKVVIDGVEYAIAAVLAHPSFAINLRFDAALIRLVTEVPDAEPVSLLLDGDSFRPDICVAEPKLLTGGWAPDTIRAMTHTSCMAAYMMTTGVRGMNAREDKFCAFGSKMSQEFPTFETIPMRAKNFGLDAMMATCTNDDDFMATLPGDPLVMYDPVAMKHVLVGILESHLSPVCHMETYLPFPPPSMDVGAGGMVPTLFTKADSVMQWVMSADLGGPGPPLGVYPPSKLQVTVRRVTFPANASMHLYDSGLKPFEEGYGVIAGVGECSPDEWVFDDRGTGAFAATLEMPPWFPRDACQPPAGVDCYRRHGFSSKFEYLSCEANFHQQEDRNVNATREAMCKDRAMGGIEGCVFADDQCRPPCQVNLDKERLTEMAMSGRAIRGGLGEMTVPGMYTSYFCVKDWNPLEQLSCGARPDEFVCFRLNDQTGQAEYMGLNRDRHLVPDDNGPITPPWGGPGPNPSGPESPPYPTFWEGMPDANPILAHFEAKWLTQPPPMP